MEAYSDELKHVGFTADDQDSLIRNKYPLEIVLAWRQHFWNKELSKLREQENMDDRHLLQRMEQNKSHIKQKVMNQCNSTYRGADQWPPEISGAIDDAIFEGRVAVRRNRRGTRRANLAGGKKKARRRTMKKQKK